MGISVEEGGVLAAVLVVVVVSVEEVDTAEVEVEAVVTGQAATAVVEKQGSLVRMGTNETHQAEAGHVPKSSYLLLVVRTHLMIRNRLTVRWSLLPAQHYSCMKVSSLSVNDRTYTARLAQRKELHARVRVFGRSATS